jgi:hypothetical protein
MVKCVSIPYGICCGQRGIGAGFVRVLQLLLPVRIPPNAPHSVIVLSSTPIYSGCRQRRLITNSQKALRPHNNDEPLNAVLFLMHIAGGSYSYRCAVED